VNFAKACVAKESFIPRNNTKREISRNKTKENESLALFNLSICRFTSKLIPEADLEMILRT